MTPKEQILTCDKLCFDYAHLFEDIQKKYPDWNLEIDPRLTIISIPEKALLAYRINLSFINNELKSNEWWESNVPNTKKLMRQDMYSQYDIFQKYSHFVLFFSHFESELRRLYRILKPGAANNGRDAFFNIFQSFFKELDCEDEAPLLAFATDIRNALHNNGYFYPNNGQNKEHEYKGNNFNFINSKPIEFVTPSLVFDLYKEFYRLTTDIVNHEKIIELEI